MITIQLQPRDSKTCGQHCVAMIAGVEVSHSINVFGHYRGTRSREQIAELKHYGLDTAPKYRVYKYKYQLPRLCILRAKHKIGSGSHVVVYANGLIYCPAYGVYRYSDYKQTFYHMRLTSYLEVIKTKT